MTVSHSQGHSQIFLSLVKVTVTSHSHWSKSQSLVKVTKISQSLWLVVKLCKTNTRWCDLVNDECSRDSFWWGWRISLGEVIFSKGSTWRPVLVEKSGPEGSLTFRHPKISKSRTTMNFKISSGEIEEIYSVSLYPQGFLLVFSRSWENCPGRVFVFSAPKVVKSRTTTNFATANYFSVRYHSGSLYLRGFACSLNGLRENWSFQNCPDRTILLTTFVWW